MANSNFSHIDFYTFFPLTAYINISTAPFSFYSVQTKCRLRNIIGSSFAHLVSLVTDFIVINYCEIRSYAVK